MPSRNLLESAGTSVLSPTERRRTLRFPFSASVELTEVQSGAKMSGRTSDLGLGGCYIDTLNPFPAGTEVKIRILKGSEAFEAQARVTFAQSGMGMGVAFVSAQPNQVRTFQAWIQEISGSSVPVSGPDAAEPVPPGSLQALSTALSELILILIKKQAISDVEGKELLRKLLP